MKSNKEIAEQLTNDPQLAAEIEKALSEAEKRGVFQEKMFDPSKSPEACGPNCVVAKYYKHGNNHSTECHCLDGLSHFNKKRIKHALEYYQSKLSKTESALTDALWSQDYNRYR